VAIQNRLKLGLLKPDVNMVCYAGVTWVFKFGMLYYLGPELLLVCSNVSRMLTPGLRKPDFRQFCTDRPSYMTHFYAFLVR
jgi:hypothetical protein